MRGLGDAQRLVVDLGLERRRHQVGRLAVGVFRGVVVEAAVRLDLEYAKRARAGRLAEHRDGDLAPRDVALDQHLGAEFPVVGIERLGVVVLAHDAHADARALGRRLDDVGPRHDVAAQQHLARHHDALGAAQAGGDERLLGRRLVHRERRGEHARVRVGDLHQVEQALDGAVLAALAVQRVEHDVGLGRQGGDQAADVARHVERVDAVAALDQRARDLGAARQRDFALGRPTAHQDEHALTFRGSAVAAHGVSPTRRISHSSVTPA